MLEQILNNTYDTHTHNQISPVKHAYLHNYVHTAYATLQSHTQPNTDTHSNEPGITLSNVTDYKQDKLRSMQ
jgi:hypothetical protein